MYNGKHLKKGKYRLTPWAVFALVLVLTVSVGGTVAYLFTMSGIVTNIFTPAPVKCEIDEPGWKDDDIVKQDVSIKNTGEADAYIRATIVVTWQNEAGEVLGKTPVLNEDYTLSINEETNENTKGGWKKGNDGYWYCIKADDVDDTKTAVLINSCEVLTSQGDYTLSVEILAQAIQAEPASVVKSIWGDANAAGLAVIRAGGGQS